MGEPTSIPWSVVRRSGLRLGWGGGGAGWRGGEEGLGGRVWVGLGGSEVGWGRVGVE